MTSISESAESRRSVLCVGGIILGLGLLLIAITSVAGIRAAERNAAAAPSVILQMPAMP
jgi:hypothetical protein